MTMRASPWSIEKLSPTLAFFVADGVEAGANRCQEILQFGGMGHTAGMHSQSREAAVRYGQQMPASRVVINSPTTHGAIGFSTDLPPSMTLGCGSWGGNVTSDNVSPIHLLDIKRVAFETKPVNAPRSSTATSRLPRLAPTAGASCWMTCSTDQQHKRGAQRGAPVFLTMAAPMKRRWYSGHPGLPRQDHA